MDHNPRKKEILPESFPRKKEILPESFALCNSSLEIPGRKMKYLHIMSSKTT